MVASISLDKVEFPGQTRGFAGACPYADFLNGRSGLVGLGLGLVIIVTSSSSDAIAVSSFPNEAEARCSSSASTSASSSLCPRFLGEGVRGCAGCVFPPLEEENTAVSVSLALRKIVAEVSGLSVFTFVGDENGVAGMDDMRP